MYKLTIEVIVDTDSLEAANKTVSKALAEAALEMTVIDDEEVIIEDEEDEETEEDEEDSDNVPV